MKQHLKTTLSAPQKNEKIPISAEWLGGEGAGSWFAIEQEKEKYIITRFAPNGFIECKGYFEANDTFREDENFTMQYLSHCAEVNVVQATKHIKFTLLEKIKQ